VCLPLRCGRKYLSFLECRSPLPFCSLVFLLGMIIIKLSSAGHFVADPFFSPHFGMAFSPRTMTCYLLFFPSYVIAMILFRNTTECGFSFLTTAVGTPFPLMDKIGLFGPRFFFRFGCGFPEINLFFSPFPD